MHPDAEQAAQLCRTLTQDLESIEVQCRLREWEAECTGDESVFAEVERLRKQVMKRLANRDDFALVERLLKSPNLDELQRRELLRWRNRLASHQYDEALIEKIAAEETALVQQYNSFRADLDGEAVADNRIDSILSSSVDNNQVEAAWRASKRIASFTGSQQDQPPVAERLLGLVRLRNQAAKSIGYPNAYRASLELGELDQDWLFETLDHLEAQTRPLFAEWKSQLDEQLAKRFQIGVDQLRPWHYGDRFFQTVPEAENESLDKWYQDKDIVALTVRTFDELGFDIRSIVKNSDLFPGDPKTSRKCQHAFCTTIVAPTDVRVLCNIVPTERWMGTNLHEFGHAVYGASLDANLPYILRDDPHTLTNEAIAMLMERHMLDARWLERIAGIPAEEAQRIASRGKRRLALKHLVFTRWVLVMCHFERALYENPDRDDLGKLWWDYVERFQLLTRPEPDRNDDDWAAKIHFVGYPAYYQNYLLGEVFGAQLQNAIERECGSFVGNPKAGDFLKERMFREGAKFNWQTLLERITGEPFNTRYFIAAATP